MNIGDLVLNKKLGLPLSGEVISICTAEFFKNFLMSISMMQSVINWSDVYPDWENEEIVAIKLSSLQKVMNLSRFTELLKNKGIPDNEIKILYKHGVSETNTAFLPEADLEIVE